MDMRVARTPGTEVPSVSVTPQEKSLHPPEEQYCEHLELPPVSQGSSCYCNAPFYYCFEQPPRYPVISCGGLSPALTPACAGGGGWAVGGGDFCEELQKAHAPVGLYYRASA